MRLVLASTSRFRREMLSRLGLPFEALAPVCDETLLSGESALDTACRLARIKARSLGERCPDALIIGLTRWHCWMANSWHPARCPLPSKCSGAPVAASWFHTALALYDARCDMLRERVDITTVRMRDLSDGQIAAYLEREPDAIHQPAAA